MIIRRNFVIKIILFAFFILTLSSTVTAQVNEAARDPVCAIYFTALGCSNCAETDPFLFQELLPSYQGEVVFIEYRLYFYPLANPPISDKANNSVAEEYYQNYLGKSSVAVPLLLINKNKKAHGRFEVLEADSLLREQLQQKERTCALADGTSVPFEQLDLNGLEGHPSFWKDDRVLSKEGGGGVSNDILRGLLMNEDPTLVLAKLNYNSIEAKPALISEGEISFENAVEIGGWLFRWDGESLPIKKIAGEEKDKNSCSSCYLKNIYVGGAIGGVILLTFIIYFFLSFKKKN